MQKEIKDWLSGPRNYTEGVVLYEKYGFNKNLKMNFNKMNPATMMQTLVYELAKLVGLTEAQANALPRTAAKPAPAKQEPQQPTQEHTLEDMILELAAKLKVSVDEVFEQQLENEEMQSTLDELKEKYQEVPETTKQVIRFREKYPFLKSPNCPDELKILTADMFAAYDAYREAYAKLDDKNSQDENFKLAQEVVEKYLQNRAMWAELDHYKEHNAILGEHPIFETLKLREEIAGLSDLDLPKKLANAKSNITKAKNAIAAAKDEKAKATADERLAKWETTKAELLAEIERRKK